VKGSRALSVNHGFLESFRLPSDCDAALLLAPPAEKLPPRGCHRGSRYYRRTHPSLGLPTRLRHPPHASVPPCYRAMMSRTHTRMSVRTRAHSPAFTSLPSPGRSLRWPLRRRSVRNPSPFVKRGRLVRQVGPAKACTHRPARHTIVYYACRSD